MPEEPIDKPNDETANSDSSTAMPKDEAETTSSENTLDTITKPETSIPATPEQEASFVEAEPPSGGVSLEASTDSTTNNTASNDTATTSQPTVADQMSIRPAKSKKKWFVIGGVIAGLLLLGGGSVAAYSWYQNPNKVLLDGVLNAVSADTAVIDGTMSYASKDVDIAMKFDTNADDNQAGMSLDLSIKPKTEDFFVDSLNLKADAVLVKDDAVYFKIGNLQPLADAYVDAMVQYQVGFYEGFGQTLGPSDIASMKQEMSKSIDPIVAKVDNQWMKVTYEELDNLSSADKGTQKCTEGVLEKASTNSSMRSELVKLYQDNRFISIEKELGVKNGSYGYVLEFDEAKAKSFAKEVSDTEFAKEMKKCDSDYAFDASDIPSSSAADTSTSRIEVWVSQWSHKMTSIKAQADMNDASEGTFDMDIATDFDAKPSVEVPKDARSFKEVQAEIERLLGGGSATPQVSI